MKIKEVKRLVEADVVPFRAMNKEVDKISRSIEKLIPIFRSRPVRDGMKLAREIEPKSGREMSEAILTVISKLTDAQEAIGLIRFFQDRALQLERKAKKK